MTTYGLSPGLVLRMGIAQLLNWGLTFYLPGAFGHAIALDLGWSGQQVFAGLSVAMLVMGMVSPFSGHLIERYGGRHVMQIGALLNALGCLGLACCSSPLAYFSAWLVLGVGMRLSLYDAAFATLAGLAGANARPVMVQITLIGGLASSVFWPVGHGLLEAFGWRVGVGIYAGLALLSVVLLIGLPDSPRRLPEPLVVDAIEALSVARKGLYAAGVALIGFISAGLSAHLPGVLVNFGVPMGFVALWGIGQTCARLAQSLLAQSMPAVRLNLWVGTGLVLCFSLGLVSEGHVLPACLFVFGYGALNGLATLLRASLPFELFAQRHYAKLLGSLVAPGFLLSAVAPWFYAAVRDGFGDRGILSLSLGLSLLFLVIASVLQRITTRGRCKTCGSDRGVSYLAREKR